MLFRVGEIKARLLDCSTTFALKPRNLDNQFNLSVTDRKHFECSFSLAKLYDIAGFAVRAPDIVAVHVSLNNGLAAQKTELMY